ncbi:hypothetical protein NMY22_g16548 [Coprinellus aureogranulatus]|nr:hypothetical protein NMY22_g16548 [Coprinellus aureogranulatus]
MDGKEVLQASAVPPATPTILSLLGTLDLLELTVLPHPGSTSSTRGSTNGATPNPVFFAISGTMRIAQAETKSVQSRGGGDLAGATSRLD